jgi:TM2 domain-containing membrane protein YozV
LIGIGVFYRFFTQIYEEPKSISRQSKFHSSDYLIRGNIMNMEDLRAQYQQMSFEELQKLKREAALTDEVMAILSDVIDSKDPAKTEKELNKQVNDNKPVRNQNEKFCSECGAVINVKAEICPKCGVRQMAAPNAFSAVAPNGKNKLVAALFAILLGGIGIHKFYLGNIVWGIIYLIFCWTFIPAIIGLIEGILLLVMSDEEFIQKYGSA